MKVFPTKISSKAKMFALSSSIQHYTEDSSWEVRQGKRKKKKKPSRLKRKTIFVHS